MSVSRFFAVLMIFAGVSLAWMILGGTLEFRTSSLEDSLSKEVNSLWGPADLVQWAPHIHADPSGQSQDGRTGPIKSVVTADFEHHNRYKGLLWFSTYSVKFAGTYQVQGRSSGAFFSFALPDGINILENLSVTLDGDEQPESYAALGGKIIRLPISPDGAAHEVRIAFETRGRDSWKYSSS